MKTTIICVLITILFSITSISCSNSSDEELQPSLSSNNVTLSEGASTTITLTNGTIIYAKATDEIVSIKVDKNNIQITAIKAGETTITISTGRHKLTCAVTITKRDNNPETDEEKPYDTTELQNSTSRLISSSFSITYDTPGIIFSIENDNHITIYDLNTDNRIDFSIIGEKALGELNQPRLTINDNIVSITNARIEQLTADGMWILLTTIEGDHIWLVITDI